MKPNQELILLKLIYFIVYVYICDEERKLHLIENE